MFLEGNFAYAVYDFLECKKEEGGYNRLKERLKEEKLRILEKIAKEAFSLGERKVTRRFLNEMVNNDGNDRKGNIKILEKLDEVFKYYLFLFYKESA